MHSFDLSNYQEHQAGILNGKGNNKFDPQGTVTRAEVSTILKRFIELMSDSDIAQDGMMNN